MRFAYGERETMLYALSVGMGRDPLDAREQPFVFEGAGLQAVPTMAVVLASTGIIRKLGIDFARILHGEQRLTLHRQLPVRGRTRRQIHASLPFTTRVPARAPCCCLRRLFDWRRMAGRCLPSS